MRNHTNVEAEKVLGALIRFMLNAKSLQPTA